ncbi:MAG: M3 family metallopeptidase [Candidatus Xenobia bacterium]
MSRLAPVLDELAEQFTRLHKAKEDRFWNAKMGLGDDAAQAQSALAAAEIEVNRFLQDPKRLERLRELEAADGTPEEHRRLQGWITMFAAHVVEQPEARQLAEEIVELEQALQTKRSQMKLGFVDPRSGQFEAASSVKLSLMMRTDPDEGRRQAAYEGLRGIGPMVLEAGFLDIVRKRNQLGRMLGYEDYYDWRTSVVERMPKQQIFALLDDLLKRTADRAHHELKRFGDQHGEGSLSPWNFMYMRSGSLMAALDPYFGFSAALERWGRSFAALHIQYRGATLTLDLLDRKGKYENGFMHGPEVAWSDHGRFRPARINFTANAVPGQIGSGMRALETLFHEGGHAAHFSNIQADAPCYSHEFAPTSVAYAETQSMFLDSLVGDADWRARYANDANGDGIPIQLIEQSIREHQPFRGWDVRAMVTIPLAERTLYEIPDAELTPERVQREFDRIERKTQGLSAGIRPVLAVPHLLAGESSAYYHAYVLAEMGVYQTRAFFLQRDGHLMDNPRVGPDLAEHYWKPGNAATYNQTLESLTGSPLSADALVAACNRTVETALQDARDKVGALARIPRFEGKVDLAARVRVVHGREEVADTDQGGFEAACAAFAAWIEKQTVVHR